MIRHHRPAPWDVAVASLSLRVAGTRPMTQHGLRQQAWKFYFVAVSWPAYVFVLPYIHKMVGWWSLGFMLFPGAYLLNWMALLFHECWHGYVPNINNRFFYHLYGWMLLSDPQLFGLLHAHHHSRVSTWDDREVHPFGYIHYRPLRILNNLLELTLGMLYVLLAWYVVVPFHHAYAPRYRLSMLAWSVVMWIVLAGTVGFASHWVFGVSASDILMPFTVSFWLGTLLLHYSTLTQHGNLIVDGDIRERNRWVRCVRAEGIVERLFLFLTHQDQPLHHNQPAFYWRVFRSNQGSVPEGAVSMRLSEVLIVVRDMILGRPTDHGLIGRVEKP